LPGFAGALRFVDAATGESHQAMIIEGDAYVLKARAPAGIIAGRTYNVFLSAGAGGAWGERQADETIKARRGGADYWKLGLPWAADFTFYDNVYNVRTDPRLALHAAGDGTTNDLQAVQAAIDKANVDGGGIVHLPAGTYRIAFTSGVGIAMRSNVVVRG